MTEETLQKAIQIKNILRRGISELWCEMNL